MAKTPTRPPNLDRNRRRPPKGPRLVPISNADQQRVAKVKQAAARLREVDSPELAEHVDFLLTDEGRKFIGRVNWQKTADEKPNMPLYMPEKLRDAIKAKAAAAGANLEAEADHAIDEFLAGRFTPAQPVTAPRGQAPVKKNLNVRLLSVKRAQAEALSRQLLAEGELDWEPNITNILSSYFADRVEEDFRNPIRKKQDQAG
ncbi:hypothetical protein AB0M00_43870 [Streptomyces chartreusis]|uniref:hypothetical protein n=1 Tax=Streptomyces chartreusis TaxID=1969 RepID=UPI00342C49C7